MILAAGDFGGLLPVFVLALIVLIRTLAIARRRGPAPPPAAPAPAEDDERTRRVRELVQRRIAERRIAPPVLPSAPPVPPAPPDPGDLLRKLVGVETEEEPAAPEPVEDRAELERQRRLENELRALEATRAAEAAKAAAAVQALVPRQPIRTGGWLADLRGDGGARRAIVMREIIGPPLALRR